jgi:hypothetical protein
MSGAFLTAQRNGEAQPNVAAGIATSHPQQSG